MNEQKITKMHEAIKLLLENNIDIAISDDACRELEKLDEFLQWMEDLGYT